MTVYDRPVRPLPGGLRPRRHLPALAGQDDHRVRRPPVLHDHDEPPSAAHQRVVRGARDGAGQERRRGQPRLLPRARHERPRRQRLVHRQPGGRVAPASLAHLPRRHHLRGDPGARCHAVQVEGRSGHRDRRDQGVQPARRGGLLLPPQADGLEDRRRAGRGSGPTATTSGTEAPPLPAERARRLPAPPARVGGRAPAGPALAPHPRPLADPRLRGDAAADAGRPCRAALRAIPRRLPDGGRLCRARALPRWSACGRASATTGGPSTCTGPPPPSWPSTAAWCRERRRAARACPASGLHRAGGAVVRLRRGRGHGRHQRGAGARPMRRRRAAVGRAPAMELGTGSSPPAPRGSSTRRCSTSARRCARRTTRLRAVPPAPAVRLATRGATGPPRLDPWRRRPTARPQSTFAGSDRQGRGRLLDALATRAGARRRDWRGACGWPDDPARAERVAAALVDEGSPAGPRAVLPSRSLRWAARRVEGVSPVEASRRRQDAVEEARRCGAFDDVGPLDVEEVAGAVDDLHLRSLGQEVEGRADGREQHAVVVAAVEVERRLGRGEQRRGLLLGQLGHLQRRGRRGPGSS